MPTADSLLLLLLGFAAAGPGAAAAAAPDDFGQPPLRRGTPTQLGPAAPPTEAPPIWENPPLQLRASQPPPQPFLSDGFPPVFPPALVPAPTALVPFPPALVAPTALVPPTAPGRMGQLQREVFLRRAEAEAKAEAEAAGAAGSQEAKAEADAKEENLGLELAKPFTPNTTVPMRYRSMDMLLVWPDRPKSDSPLPSWKPPLPLYFKQRQDHFDGASRKTWSQAYYMNSDFWLPGNNHSPVFLCVGGEGPPLDGTAVVRSVHCNVAVEWLQSKGALMLALEHRYYGCHNRDSCPVEDLSAPGALRFLSSRQALADIAEFVRHITATMRLSPGNRWVAWGGSYPGMLASWARLKFPHLIYAAVASSAPVRAELDMRGYNDAVADAYAVSHERVGGSTKCRDAVATGHKTIGDMFLTEDGRVELAEIFGGDPDEYSTFEQQRTFAGSGVANFPAQNNDPSTLEPMGNIAKICSVMTNASLGNEVRRLAHVREGQARSAVPQSFWHSPTKPSAAFLWAYQTCTEFGFFQTCELGSRCFFTQGLVTLKTEMFFCGLFFGLERGDVARNVEETNLYYGSDRPVSSRVFFVDGEIDPWRSNSLNKNLDDDPETLIVTGASHHAWTHPSSRQDQDSVVEARELIREFVTIFLWNPTNQSSRSRSGPAEVFVV